MEALLFLDGAAALKSLRKSWVSEITDSSTKEIDATVTLAR